MLELRVLSSYQLGWYVLFWCLSSRHAGAESFVAHWTLNCSCACGRLVSHFIRSRACGPACAVKYFPGSIIAMLLLVAAGPEQSHSATARLGRAHSVRTLAAISPPEAGLRPRCRPSTLRSALRRPRRSVAGCPLGLALPPWGGIVGRRLHVQVVVFSAPSCSFHATSRASIHASSADSTWAAGYGWPCLEPFFYVRGLLEAVK